MKLYVIRHGETDCNARGVYTGQSQAKLTEKGIEEAKRIKFLFDNKQIDKVYTSTLIRTQQTAECVVSKREFEPRSEICEIDVGNLVGMTRAKAVEKYGEHFLDDLKINNFVDYGGENVEQFEKRVVGFIKEIEMSDYDSVAIFVHAGVLRCVMKYVLGRELKNNTYSCTNCTVGIFEYNGESWRMRSYISPEEL